MSASSIDHHLLPASGISPNNDELPLILYRGAVAFTGGEPELDVENLFWGNGWGDGFRGDTFPFHHYHSVAHEVVGCARGRARIQFGGPDGPEFDVAAGDVVLIPAGVAHRRLDDAPGFVSVGAYPAGQQPDLCVFSRADAETARRTPEVGDLNVVPVEAADLAAARARIARVALPESDPVGGAEGALAALWRAG
jgi:uncharacterized protein YjlB